MIFCAFFWVVIIMFSLFHVFIQQYNVIYNKIKPFLFPASGLTDLCIASL